MSKIPIALQLYSVREDCTRDFPTTLEAVAKMGYCLLYTSPSPRD